MVLADMGADVVKVEDPRVGDYLRALPPAKGGMGGRFLAVNRGKRSLALDLKAPAGRDALLRMAEKADVVVESFRPGVMDKLGVGYAALAAQNPKIVVCSISGYGQTGPYVDRAGHDLNYIALAGVLAMSGPAGGAPQMPGVQVADLAGGALWGATAILGALVGRDRTGKGEHLDISMTEGALALLAAEIGNFDCGMQAHARPRDAQRRPRLLRRLSHRRRSLPRGRRARAEVLDRAEHRDRPAAESSPSSLGNQAKHRGELADIFATKTAADWMDILGKHDCCVEIVTELAELPQHPLHAERGVFFEIDGGEQVGRVLQVRTPVGAPANPTPPPRLGQHSRDVLAEYGFSDAEITGIVGG